MGVLDFLFEGRPPQSVTTYGQTVENIPKWMSDYTQGLIARANAAAAEPYIPYGGPRIAGFSPEQEQAFQMTEEGVGGYEPYLQGALEQTVGATERFPEAVDQYMDPYVEHVLGRQEDLATRTLEEEFLPRLQRTFAGAGQYGSRGGFGSMEDIGVRGVRDISEGLERQRLATLSDAYTRAGDLFGQDLSRQLAAGRQMGALGEAAQQLGLRDVAALEAVGRQRQGLGQRSMDLAYQDFLEQRNLPFERLGFMSDIIRGLPYSRAVQTQQTGPADVYQPSPLSQLVGGYGVYRGLTSAEGGYVDDEDLGEYIDGDVTDEFKHEYAKGYQAGGLASYAGPASHAPTVSEWAQNLYPDVGRTVGVSGGHYLKLDHKQD